jgi:hypothetical protein
MKGRLVSQMTWRAIGVASAAVIAVCINVLCSRFHARWDWTSAGIYTLSPATLDTLHGLDEPIDVTVLLSRDDPLHASVRQMLETYGAESRQLRSHFVDPDRSPAEFMAVQQRYDLTAGRTEAGRLVTDASLIVARGSRHWFVASDDIVSYDEGAGRSRPRLEQALTEGLRNVIQKDKLELCFTTGHQEISIDDVAPTGLMELRRRLGKNNYDVRNVDLVPPLGPVPFDGCAVVLVAGPEVPFDSASASAIGAFLSGGGSALFFLPPMLDEGHRLRPSGLEAIVRQGGIELGRDFVLEPDPSFRLPTGVGESFFATPKSHDVTRGLVRAENQIDYRVLVVSAQSLSDARAPAGPKPSLLLATSSTAFGIEDVRALFDSAEPPSPGDARHAGPLGLAFAAELAPADKARGKRAARMVVVGSANMAWTKNWREPALLGTRLFTENTVSWLAARPPLVSVPEKPGQTVGLSLTEESLGEVWRYVLLYMPGAAVLLGIYVMLRRRSVEKHSRREAER